MVYGVGSQDYYSAIWTQEEQVILEDLPMTGRAGTGLSGFDDIMQDFMKARNIKAGALRHHGRRRAGVRKRFRLAG